MGTTWGKVLSVSVDHLTYTKMKEFGVCVERLIRLRYEV